MRAFVAIAGVVIVCIVFVRGSDLGAQRSNAELYRMMQDADSLRVVGRHASAHAIYDSVHTASMPVRSSYDSMLVASALCNTAQMHADAGDEEKAASRFRRCTALLGAMEPTYSMDLWDNVAAFYGRTGRYCLQMRAWAHAARTAEAAGDSARTIRYDACAGRALRLCERPLEETTDGGMPLWSVLAICATAWVLAGCWPGASTPAAR